MIEAVRNKLDPEKWIDKYADQLLRFAMMRVPDHQQAEDIVQECFLSAWKSRDSFNGSNERTWLYAICRNKIIDYYRSASVTAHVSLDYFFDEADHWTEEAKPGHWSIQDVNNDNQSPQFAHLDQKDFYKVLDSCRAKLNSMQYAVFTLKYLDQMETKEICTTLKITLQNYWVLVHRAKLQLRECLQQHWLTIK